jgi:Cys/Met metabolism PLP-dependent enzyme
MNSENYLAERTAALVAASSISLPEVGSAGESFAVASDKYQRASAQAAVAILQRVGVAAAYANMDKFWEDAAAQASGVSELTFWDTYEHGLRRRYESLLAEVAGLPSALLVNSGMAALDTAIAAADLRPGDVLLCMERHYFETEELLSHVLSARGIQVERVDMSNEAALSAALRKPNVKAVLIESFLNGPEVEPAALTPQSVGPDIAIIIDNSVIGPAAKWVDLLPANQLLVVESGLKYLCHRCSSGIIYGGRLLDKARLYARRTGIQLQSTALAQFQPFELAHLTHRIKLHGENRRRFAAVLRSGPWRFVRDADDAARAASSQIGALIRGSGGGALLFAAIDADAERQPAYHRMIVALWLEKCRNAGLATSIRAGFGWDETSLRSYEGTQLNRIGAGSFIRISAGIGPIDEIATSAQILNEAATTVIEENRPDA